MSKLSKMPKILVSLRSVFFINGQCLKYENTEFRKIIVV
jgi:hypothetical protein